MSNVDPSVLSGGGITVHKSYADAAYPEPAIVIIIEQFEPGPRKITLTETLPPAADGTLIEFDTETADHWTTDADTLELTVSLRADEAIETAYTYAGSIADALDTWVTPPEVVIEFENGETTALQPAEGEPPETVVHAPERVTETDNAAPDYGDGVAYQPSEPEAVEPGDVYGQGEATPFERHTATTPESSYGEIETRWSEAASTIAAHSSYGEDDTAGPNEPAAVSGGHRYGDGDTVEQDESGENQNG